MVKAEVEEAQRDITLPQRLTRSKFKELGSSGRLFSLFIVSFVKCLNMYRPGSRK